MFTVVDDYNSIDKLERLGNDLMKRGWTTAQVEKLLGRNLMRLYGEVWAAVSRRLRIVPIVNVAAKGCSSLPEISTQSCLRSLPHRKGRCDKIWIVERSEGNCDEIVELVVEFAVDLVMHVGAALRAEVEGGAVAAVGDVDPALRLALDRDLLRRPARLHREGATRALLAIEAVADGNSYRARP